MTQCYRVRKPMLIGIDTREPGDLVPEMVIWEGHVQARLLQTQFLELSDCDEDELLAALSYADPEVSEAWGVEPLLSTIEGQVVQVDAEPLPEAPAAPESDEELLPEEDTLISESVPAADYEGLSWPELRKLGTAAGLPQTTTKDEILAHLALAED